MRMKRTFKMRSFIERLYTMLGNTLEEVYDEDTKEKCSTGAERSLALEQREIAQQLLFALSDTSKHFYTVDGSSAGSLMDLFSLLQDMDEHSFSFHANGEKNDFSAWIESCIGDRMLAQKILSMTDKDEVTLAVGYRVKELLSRSR